MGDLSYQDRFGTVVHLMAGQVAHWMNLHRELIAPKREDCEILSKTCERIKEINERHSEKKKNKWNHFQASYSERQEESKRIKETYSISICSLKHPETMVFD